MKNVIKSWIDSVFSFNRKDNKIKISSEKVNKPSMILVVKESDKGLIATYEEEKQIELTTDDIYLGNLLKLGVQLKPNTMLNGNSQDIFREYIESNAREILNSIENNNINND